MTANILPAIERINILQFRGLNQVEIRDMGQFNLLVGANNSGKTSVLESIAVSCRPLDPFEWLNTAWRREIKAARTPLLESLRWLFPQSAQLDNELLYNGQAEIELQAHSATATICRVRAAYQEMRGVQNQLDAAEFPQVREIAEQYLFDSETQQPRLGTELTLEVEYKQVQPTLFAQGGQDYAQEKFTIWENERFTTRKAAREPYLPVATVTPVSHRVEQAQINQLSEAIWNNFREDILNVLQMFDPQIENVEILARQGMRPTPYLRHKTTGFSPLSAFGDGGRRAFSIATLIPQLSGGVLLIDEIESAIHISAFTKFYRWLVTACTQYQVQVIASTHSLEALDSLIQIEQNQDAIIVYRMESPHKSPQRLSGDLLQRLRFERGLEVR